MSGHYGEPALCVKLQCCILLSWPGSQLGVSTVKMSLLHSPRTPLSNLFGNQTMALVIHASAYKPGFCCSCCLGGGGGGVCFVMVNKFIGFESFNILSAFALVT